MASPVQGRPSAVGFGGSGVGVAQRAGAIPAHVRSPFASALAGKGVGEQGLGVQVEGKRAEERPTAEAKADGAGEENGEVEDGAQDSGSVVEGGTNEADGAEDGQAGVGIDGTSGGEGTSTEPGEARADGATAVAATTPSTVHELNAELLAQSRWALNLLRGLRADGSANAAGAEAGRRAAGGERDAVRRDGVGVSGVEGREVTRGTTVGEQSGRERVEDAGTGVVDRRANGAKASESAENAGTRLGVGTKRGAETGAKVSATEEHGSGQIRVRVDDVQRLSTMRSQAVRESVLGVKGVSAGEGARPVGTAMGSGEGASVAVIAAKIGTGTKGNDGGGERSNLGLAEGRQQAAGGRGVGEAGTLTNAQSAAVRAQALRGLVSAISRGETSLTIRMDPRQLGSLSIDVDMREGAVEAKFAVTTREARRLLEGSMTDLRRELEARGLEVGRLEVARVERSEDADVRALTDERGEEGRSPEDEPDRRFGADARAFDDGAERRSRGDGDADRAVGAAVVETRELEDGRGVVVGVGIGIDALV
ncbi:MAG: flagellar hook-length control protein FliK [Phycisphaeraceae bacterium]|nr:flagellar hook-length control protein FliK [Phycisphaeraceae bacterium]